MKPRVDLFRRLALTLPEAVESSHMGHPDFRINDRIFATLSAQERGRGTLKLTIEQQQAFIAEMPTIFEPVQGGWGRMGMTFVDLGHVDEETLKGALITAYNNVKLKQAKKKVPGTTKRAGYSSTRLQ
ncbi:MmcQ/YjbR family DNA-binding protein [Edaphobacter paludis]|uniref:MmcQ/YjbR family DNA-binding protein n=1 Tax=Edaphobacter paludis TaxID=3035702 RepID=A0AAU7CVD5_9BACT